MIRQQVLHAFARVYRVDRRTKELLTPLGLWLAAGLLISAVLGINTRLNLASQWFALLAVMFLLSGLVGCGFRPRLRIERSLPSLASVGEPCRYRVRVSNRGHRILRGLVLHDELAEQLPGIVAFRARLDPLDRSRNAFDRLVGYPRWLGMVVESRGGESPCLELPSLAPGQSLDFTLELIPRRRGWLRFRGFRLSRPDPLGLINSVCRQQAPARLLVLPQRYPVATLELGGSRRYQPLGQMPVAHRGDSEEIIGLRPYQPGDPLKTLHWKSWARVGEPVVCEYRPEYLSRHALVLDTLGPAVAPAMLEAAVSVAASLACGLDTRDNLVDLVFVGDRVYRISSGPGSGETLDLLRVLATTEASPERPFQDLARQLLADDPPYSGCCLVLLGWDTARAGLVRALRQRGKTVLALVVGAPGDPPPTSADYHYLPGDGLARTLSGLSGVARRSP